MGLDGFEETEVVQMPKLRKRRKSRGAKMHFYLQGNKIIMDSGPEEREITQEELLEFLQGHSGKQYAKTRHGFTPSDGTADSLPTGAYDITVSMFGDVYFQPKSPLSDGIVDVSDTATEIVTNQIRQFWGIEDFFKKRSYTKKRGVLLYGPPGTGKTTTIHRLSQDTIAAGGVVIYPGRTSHMKAGLNALRSVEPERPIVCVLEDLEDYAREDEETLTAILDGDESVSNIVYIATTNYINSLPARITKRPSRFDLVIPVEAPEALARKEFLRAKTDLSGDTLDEWAEATAGMSFAHLKELDIAVNGFGHDFDLAVQRVQKMIEQIKQEEE